MTNQIVPILVSRPGDTIKHKEIRLVETIHPTEETIFLAVCHS